MKPGGAGTFVPVQPGPWDAMASKIINKTKVKEAASDFRVSSDFYDRLNAEVYDLVEQAKKRAEQNGRSTLMPHDL